MLLRPPSSTLTDTLLPYPSLFRPAVSSRLRAIFERLGEVPDPGPEVGMEEPAVDLDTYRTLSDEASALDRERDEARRKNDHITALLGANTEAASLYRDAYIAHVAAWEIGRAPV